MVTLNPEIKVDYSFSIGCPMIHNRYIVHVMYGPNPFTDEMINKRYLYLKKETAEAFKNEEFDKYVFLHERPYRFETYLEIPKDKRTQSLLYEVWRDSENPEINLDIWLLEMRRLHKIHGMFIDDNDKKSDIDFKGGETTVYYGHCGDEEYNHTTHLSWTLEESVAKWFSERYEKPYQSVIKKKIKRSDIKAYLTLRDEAEIILFD